MNGATSDGPSTAPETHKLAPQPTFPRLVPVPVQEIEGEFEKQWRAANAHALASGGPIASRNSVSTLVVYTSDQPQASWAYGLVSELSQTHPSRIIILTTRPDTTGAPVQAYMGTQVFGDGASPAYGENILLEATRDAAQYLPGVALPLIVSGLPSFLWWAQDPPWRSEQFEAMVDGVDRLLVDTSDMQQPERALIALEDLMTRKRSSVAISDFNWTRGSPWREMVAQFFDAATVLPYLSHLDRIIIEYAAGGEDQRPNAAAAFLFAGWLTSRLDWRIVSAPVAVGGSEQELTLVDQTGRRIMLQLNARFGVPVRSWHEIIPELRQAQADAQAAEAGKGNGTKPTNVPPPAVGPGALMSIHLHAVAEGQQATFTAAREADLRNASTLCQVPGMTVPSQTVHLPSIGEAALLAEQVEATEHDPLFEDALTSVALMLGPSARRLR